MRDRIRLFYLATIRQCKEKRRKMPDMFNLILMLVFPKTLLRYCSVFSPIIPYQFNPFT